jgi:hypothetical protein
MLTTHLRPHDATRQCQHRIAQRRGDGAEHDAGAVRPRQGRCSAYLATVIISYGSIDRGGFRRIGERGTDEAGLARRPQQGGALGWPRRSWQVRRMQVDDGGWSVEALVGKRPDTAWMRSQGLSAAKPRYDINGTPAQILRRGGLQSFAAETERREVF